MTAQVQTLTLQPGPVEGKDALIRDDYPYTPMGSVADFTSNAWTISGDPVILRSLIYFDLSSIPTSATILGATFSLYCNINSGYYQLQSGDNASYLLKIAESWDENLVTWTTQPNVTLHSSVLLPTSSSMTQDYPDIDVIAPVKEMVLNPSSNFGWMIRLVIEEYYRSMVFASSDNTVEALRPKLVVNYKNCLATVAHYYYQIEDSQVNFFDSSSYATSWYWSFGDGYYSNLQNPVHEYYEPGKYLTCLQITDSCGSDEYCDTVFYCHSPDTKYSYSIIDHFVNFHDTSYQPITWYWNFGDGFYSDLRDPLHYFNDFGTYYVCLTSGNACMRQTYCDSVEVKPNGIEKKPDNEISIYPNPAKNMLFISFGDHLTGNHILIEIIDLTGITRKTEKINSMTSPGLYQLDISFLSSGAYCLRIVTETKVLSKNLLVL